MAIFKCKMCGGDLDVQNNSTVCECEYCGTKQTVPSADNEKKVNLFNRANRLRRNCEFDKASGVYESIAAEFPKESEAYWELCLCKYGIEYVDDPATAKKIPTCHRTSYDSIFQDSNFDLACEYADSVARQIYRAEAKEIERLQKEILDIAKNEEPFDIFICYKETTPDGQRTKDSVLAQDIYDALTAKGYKVFFSRITLEDKLGQDYEPYIFSALNSAKVMLAIGTDYEYFNAVWVKNEWSRFLALMSKDKSKTLIPCYCDIDAEDMPEEFRRLQGQDMGKVGFIQDLVRGIGKIIPLTSNEPQRVVVQQQASGNPTVDSLIKRAMLFLEDGEFTKADEYAEKVLDADPENGYAYLVKLCVEHSVRKPDELAKLAISLDTFTNFEKAIKYGDDSLKDLLQKTNEKSLETKRQAEIAHLTQEAFHFIEDDNWERARKCFIKVLDIDPTNAKAHLGILQVEYKIKSIEKISTYDTLCLVTNNTFPNNPNLLKVLQFSDDKSCQILKEIQAKALIYPNNDKKRKKKLMETYHSTMDKMDCIQNEAEQEISKIKEKHKKEVDAIPKENVKKPLGGMIIVIFIIALIISSIAIYFIILGDSDEELTFGLIIGCIGLGVVPAAMITGIVSNFSDKRYTARVESAKREENIKCTLLERELKSEINRIKTKEAEEAKKRICLWCGSVLNDNEIHCGKCEGPFTISIGEVVQMGEKGFTELISQNSILPPDHDYMKKL